MVLWIVIGVVVAAVALWAFWPRARGVDDRSLARSRRGVEGRIEESDIGKGGHIGPMFPGGPTF